MKENGNIKVIEPTDDFKRIHKSIIRNKNIDCLTLGIYCKIVVLGADWQLNIKGLSNILGVSDKKVRASIGILEREGYVKREANYHDNKLDGWVYNVYPEPLKDEERSRAGYKKNNEKLQIQCCAESSVTQNQTTLESDITENGEDNNNRLNIIEDLKNNKTNNKEEDTNVSPKKNDYHAIVECWNECNGQRLGKVTKVTQRRKGAIKKALLDNDITQEQLMQFFKTLPFADSWLYNPNKQHKNWKPDFDWWLANTNGWLTKGLEGKVHLENPQAYSSIMGGDDAPYRPQTDGNIHWNDYYKCYIFIGMFWDEVMDGYTDDNRPNGATLMLNNGGTIVWNKEQKKWEKQ